MMDGGRRTLEKAKIICPPMYPHVVLQTVYCLILCNPECRDAVYNVKMLASTQDLGFVQGQC